MEAKRTADKRELVCLLIAKRMKSVTELILFLGWTKPNAFHVCITSYKLVIQDHQAFRRKRWRYFILDEAQNIKNFKSQRWQLLLNFQSQRYDLNFPV